MSLGSFGIFRISRKNTYGYQRSSSRLLHMERNKLSGRSKERNFQIFLHGSLFYCHKSKNSFLIVYIVWLPKPNKTFKKLGMRPWHWLIVLFLVWETFNKQKRRRFSYRISFWYHRTNSKWHFGPWWTHNWNIQRNDINMDTIFYQWV